MGRGVAELQLLAAGKAEAEGRFGSGDVEVLYVDGLVGLGEGEGVGSEGELRVVDGVFLLQAERGGVEGEAAIRRRPVETSFVAPGGLGLQVGIADGSGVGVVEIDVGGKAEAVTGGGAEANRAAERVSGGERRREDGAVAAEDLFACSEGERETAERTEVQVSVARALVACMLAERVAVDAVAVGFEPVRESGIRAEDIGAAEGAFVAGGDVVVLVDLRLVDEENEEVGVASVAEAGGSLLAKLLLNAGEPALVRSHEG